MNLLYKYGWDSYFEEKRNGCEQYADLNIGRVISVQGYMYHLFSMHGDIEAELSGRLLYAAEPEQIPAIGDWVYYIKYEPKGYIVDILPRKNALTRKLPGKTSARQLMAANVDGALIVQGPDREFNLMRLDRYLVQIIASGIQPTIILNKTDLAGNTSFYKQEINRLGRDCSVFFCSTVTGSGIQEVLNDVLMPQHTYIMVGSSGVGKSSLINSFLNTQSRSVNELSHTTGKGKHTTTTRDLFMLTNGSLLIDTPGMREFGIALDDEQAAFGGLFPLIDRMAEECRYSNCLHVNEENCAVKKALETGELDAATYQSYIKLIKEQKRFTIQADEKKRMGKRFGKMVREVKRFKDMNG